MPTFAHSFSTKERELQILRIRFPHLSEKLSGQVVDALAKLRSLDLKKPPSISEALDWAQSLALLNADSLTPQLLASTLSLVLKHESDVEKAKGQLSALI